MRSLIKDVVLLPSWDAEPVFGANIEIEDGKILFAGCQDRARDGVIFDMTFCGAGKLAIPSFVNSHCHSAMTLLRGYADDVSLEKWLFERIIPAEAKLTEDDIYWGASLAALEMTRAGVSCVHDMYLKMDDAARAYADSGIRARLSFGPLISSERGGARVDADACRGFFARWNGASGGRLRTDVEIHSVYLYEPDALREGAALARELGAPVHIHILETAFERDKMISERGAESVALAREYGLLGEGAATARAPLGTAGTAIAAEKDAVFAATAAVAAHCVHVDDEGIRALSELGVSVAHCPTSNLKLASGIAPVKRMLEAGINVCLGTDGAASNNTLGIMEEARLAALLHKGYRLDSEAVDARCAFRMATRAGALALGFPECGVLTPGMAADIALIDLDAPHLTPTHNILSTLIYAARSSDVDSLFVAGEPLMINKKTTRIDEERVLAEAKRAARKFGARP